MLNQIIGIFGNIVNFVLKSIAVILLLFAFMLITGNGMGVGYMLFTWWDGLPIIKIVILIFISGVLLLSNSEEKEELPSRQRQIRKNK